MTENEARGKIKYRIANEMRKAGENKEAYEDLEIALQVMKEIREYREIGTVEDIQLIFSLCKDLERIVKKYEAIGTVEEFKALKEKGIPIIHGKAELELHDKKVRTKAIDEFAKRLKERLKGMQMVELQGEDVCPCRETGEDCPYMNQDVGCQYCAREQTIKDIDEIAEKMKGGVI